MRIEDDLFSFPIAYFNMVSIDILKLVQLVTKMDVENKQVERSLQGQETSIKPSYMKLCTHCKYEIDTKIDKQLGQWKDKGMTSLISHSKNFDPSLTVEPFLCLTKLAFESKMHV